MTSHDSGLPFDHGIKVAPSGRLPPCVMNPVGSFCAGICAPLIARQMMSFSMAWRWCLGVLFLHERPWSPLASASLPHIQVWGKHVQTPNLWATAIRISSPVSFSSTDAMGAAWSQSLKWGAVAAFSLARSTSELADTAIRSTIDFMTGPFQAF